LPLSGYTASRAGVRGIFSLNANPRRTRERTRARITFRGGVVRLHVGKIEFQVPERDFPLAIFNGGKKELGWTRGAAMLGR